MKTLPILALVAFAVPGAAEAKPSASIGCAMQAISAQDQASYGASLVTSAAPAQAATAAHDFIAKPAAACAKANKWSRDQTDVAISWTMWNLMAGELQRESAMSATDAAILHAYVDEDPSRLDGLERFTSSQNAQLIDALNKRGAHLHDSGPASDRELSVLMLLRQMKTEEASFDAS